MKDCLIYSSVLLSLALWNVPWHCAFPQALTASAGASFVVSVLGAGFPADPMLSRATPEPKQPIYLVHGPIRASRQSNHNRPQRWFQTQNPDVRRQFQTFRGGHFGCFKRVVWSGSVRSVSKQIAEQWTQCECAAGMCTATPSGLCAESQTQYGPLIVFLWATAPK